MMKAKFFLLSSLFSSLIILSGCATKSNAVQKNLPQEVILEKENTPQNPVSENHNNDEITLLFAGDIMAHSVNYVISDYPKIWKDVKNYIIPCDLAFANIEAPIDTTQDAQSYPNFNMEQAYVEAAIDSGFDVFSLCNNHTNDQGLTGIQETRNTTKELIKNASERNENIYFSGLKEVSEDEEAEKAPFTYNVIEKNGWKILFLPVTELLNRSSYSDYINYIKTDEDSRTKFIKYVKQLRKDNPCDLFVLSLHTAETEYVRTVTEKQNNFYMDLLDAGIDILWANHAHIIKDRKYIFNAKNHTQKVIMYANGNTISGQRTKPELSSKNPDGERDNTGDGIMVKLTFSKKNAELPPQLINSQNYFITTYINTAYEFVIKPMNQEFIDYLNDVPRKSWADYIKKRNKINSEKTKDLILWQ